MFDIDIYPKYLGKSIVPSASVVEELHNLDLDLEDVKEILEKGFEYSASKRSKDKIEKSIIRKGSILKVVAVEKSDKFLLIHLGRLTFSKNIKKRVRRLRK